MRGRHIPSTPEEQQALSGTLPQMRAFEEAVQPQAVTVSSADPSVAAWLPPGGLRTPGGQPIRAQVGYMDFSKSEAAMAGRPTDRSYDNLKLAVYSRLEATGVVPATILNFLPIPLVLNSPMESLKVRIPPAPEPQEGKDDFTFHTWQYADVVPLERGEGVKTPWEYLPVQLGQAFMAEYRDFGGVVLLRGVPTEATLSQPHVREQIREAKEQMIVWMRSKVEEANGQWNTPSNSGARNIVELHRQCALRLRDMGIIDKLPEWVTDARQLKDATKKCPVCGTMPTPGAAVCKECRHILDPMAAFMAGAITEDDLSLERLTRAEVEELGISDYVAETSDERPDRLKARRPKPVSRVMAYQYAEQQDPDPAPATPARSTEPVTAL